MISSITCTSIQQKENIIELTGYSGKISVIRTGVDIQLIVKNSKIDSSTWKNRKYILFPRKMTPLYNHELSLKAIDIISKDIDKYVMVFVDSDSYDQDYVKKIKKIMKSIEGIKFEFLVSQTQEEIWRMYYNASLVVMNPRTDGSPVSALEAMVLEKPLILGDASYDVELFSKVVKLNREDPKELSELILNELERPTNYNGFHTVSEKADRNKEMNRLLNLYDDMINR